MSDLTDASLMRTDAPAALVPAAFAEKAMATVMQLHGELMEEKERRVELYRRLMEKEQAVAELRMYVRMLEEQAGVTPARDDSGAERAAAPGSSYHAASIASAPLGARPQAPGPRATPTHAASHAAPAHAAHLATPHATSAHAAPHGTAHAAPHATPAHAAPRAEAAHAAPRAHVATTVPAGAAANDTTSANDTTGATDASGQARVVELPARASATKQLHTPPVPPQVGPQRAANEGWKVW